MTADVYGGMIVLYAVGDSLPDYRFGRSVIDRQLTTCDYFLRELVASCIIVVGRSPASPYGTAPSLASFNPP
jgi:hypothetical protein